MVVSVGQLGALAGAFAAGGKLLARTASWQSAVLWLAAPLVPAALLMLLIREPSRPSDVARKTGRSRGFPELWVHRSMMAPLFAGIVAMELTISATVVWAVPALSRQFAVAPDRLGATMGVAIAVSGLAGPVVGGAMADVCQRRGGCRGTLSVLLFLAFLNIPAAAFPVFTRFWYAAVGLVAFTTLTTAIVVMATAAFMVVIPEHVRGLCTSALNAGGILASGLAPIIVSGVSDFIGGPSRIAASLAAVGAGTGLFSVAAFSLGVRHFWRVLPDDPQKKRRKAFG